MTTLIIPNKMPTSLSHGYDLRVWYLCKVLSGHEKLVLLPISLPGKVHFKEKSITSLEDIFQEVQVQKNEGNEKASFFRHMRLREAEYFKWGFPRFYQYSVRLIKDALSRYNTNKIVVFGSELAGIMQPFRGCRVLYDVCDSKVLTIEREINSGGNTLDVFQKIKANTQLLRWKRTEGCLPHWFTHVTTINKADSDTIKYLSGGMHNISTIPNGVDPFLERMIIDNDNKKRKGIVFWGYLDFPPNRNALRYFYENVYRPYLFKSKLEWCIVGRNPDPWLQDAARAIPSIRLTGYVEDLYSLIKEYPVMVNPMISGSGMKNKVLEAFALKIAVVSTPLGIESIDGAIDGTHYLLAFNPEEFAKSVHLLLSDDIKRSAIAENAKKLLLDKWTWEKVGEKWLKIFNKL